MIVIIVKGSIGEPQIVVPDKYVLPKRRAE